MSRIRRWIGTAVLPLVAAVALVGCDDGNGLTDAEDGTVSILLTDAPGDFESAVVTITEIYLQGEGETGRVTLMDEAVTTDLLTLANDVATLVEDATVPAGTYSQLRFVIGGGYVEVEQEDGSTVIYATQGYDQVPEGATVGGTLNCPSCEQTGFKVNLPGGAVEITGEQKVLLVDFDVSQSFGHQAGQSGQWVMHPVMHATDFQATGSIVVTLQSADSVTLPTLDTTQVTLADFVPVLINAEGGEETGEFTDADEDGVYDASFTFLVPGDYSVDLQAPDSVTFTTEPAAPLDVSVPSGQEVNADFTVTSAGTEEGTT